MKFLSRTGPKYICNLGAPKHFIFIKIYLFLEKPLKRVCSTQTSINDVIPELL